MEEVLPRCSSVFSHLSKLALCGLKLLPVAWTKTPGHSLSAVPVPQCLSALGSADGVCAKNFERILHSVSSSKTSMTKAYWLCSSSGGSLSICLCSRTCPPLASAGAPDTEALLAKGSSSESLCVPSSCLWLFRIQVWTGRLLLVLWWSSPWPS